MNFRSLNSFKIHRKNFQQYKATTRPKCLRPHSLCTELYMCTPVYLQQQLRRRVGRSHSGGHGGANSVQLLDLPPPHLDQTRAVPLHPNSARPRTIRTERQPCSLRQQSGRTWKNTLISGRKITDDDQYHHISLTAP